jgi:hypothetical protein
MCEIASSSSCVRGGVVRANLGVALADMVAIDGDGLGWTVYEGVDWVRRRLMTANERAKQAGRPII